jgi:hypothetical protein
VIFFVLQQQLENHILVPKIMSRQVGVSAGDGDRRAADRRQPARDRRRDLAVPTAAILQVVMSELLREDNRRARAPARSARLANRIVSQGRMASGDVENSASAATTRCTAVRCSAMPKAPAIPFRRGKRQSLPHRVHHPSKHGLPSIGVP